MKLLRSALLAAAAIGAFSAAPASAQFFFKSRDVSAQPLRGDEPGVRPTLPGATPAELQASVIWHVRAALNVAALQCKFAPTLMTAENYDSFLFDHSAELSSAVKTLNNYFARTGPAKTKKAGQDGFDRYGTVLYSTYATVAAQYNFCQAAADVARAARFVPRGQLAQFASARLGEIRNSLVPAGEQAFTRVTPTPLTMPRLDPQCWTKRNQWDERKCGPFQP